MYRWRRSAALPYNNEISLTPRCSPFPRVSDLRRYRDRAAGYMDFRSSPPVRPSDLCLCRWQMALLTVAGCGWTRDLWRNRRANEPTKQTGSEPTTTTPGAARPGKPRRQPLTPITLVGFSEITALHENEQAHCNSWTQWEILTLRDTYSTSSTARVHSPIVRETQMLNVYEFVRAVFSVVSVN